jgi:hypothetical protein
LIRSASLLVGVVLSSFLLQTGRPHADDGVSYTSDGKLKYPTNYREWIFLSSGLDMSYTVTKEKMGAGMFNNVFVNPGAYRGYQQTGHWPEGTVLVLENRGAALGSEHDAFLKGGKVQTTEGMGMEVHVLDSAHAAGDGWAFYGFGDDKLGKVIPRPASCYTCHEAHAAVDTTFVQFYPTLLEAAEKHKTVSAGYLKEMGKH